MLAPNDTDMQNVDLNFYIMIALNIPWEYVLILVA